MEYSNEKQLKDQFEKPEIFTQRIETLKDQLPSILDDFNKYFVLYNTDPNYPEFETTFNNIKQNLNNIGASLFMLSNNVDINQSFIHILHSRSFQNCFNESPLVQFVLGNYKEGPASLLSALNGLTSSSATSNSARLKAKRSCTSIFRVRPSSLSRNRTPRFFLLASRELLRQQTTA